MGPVSNPLMVPQFCHPGINDSSMMLVFNVCLIIISLDGNIQSAYRGTLYEIFKMSSDTNRMGLVPVRSDTYRKRRVRMRSDTYQKRRVRMRRSQRRSVPVAVRGWRSCPIRRRQ